MKNMIIGWQEWVLFPDLNLDPIKAKTDTGATDSALHAYNLETFTEDGKEYVRFTTEPIAKGSISRVCTALVAGHKKVRSSNGITERRVFIMTTMTLGDRSWKIKLTLTCRKKMQYRMLLGRSAMNYITIKPLKSFCQGTPQ